MTPAETERLARSGTVAGLVDDALNSWLFAAGHAVRDVFAAGRHVVSNGRHIRAGEVRSRYAATARRLRQ